MTWSDVSCLDGAGYDALVEVMPHNVMLRVGCARKEEEKAQTPEEQIRSGELAACLRMRRFLVELKTTML